MARLGKPFGLQTSLVFIGAFCNASFVNKSSLENSMFRVKAAPFTKMIVFFHKLTFTLEFWQIKRFIGS